MSRIPLYKRVSRIFHNFLQQVDKELYDFLLEINADVAIFLMRWLRVMFVREMPYNQSLILWDAILANDSIIKIQKSNYSPFLFFC